MPLYDDPLDDFDGDDLIPDPVGDALSAAGIPRRRKSKFPPLPPAEQKSAEIGRAHV